MILHLLIFNNILHSCFNKKCIDLENTDNVACDFFLVFKTTYCYDLGLLTFDFEGYTNNWSFDKTGKVTSEINTAIFCT